MGTCLERLAEDLAEDLWLRELSRVILEVKFSILIQLSAMSANKRIGDGGLPLSVPGGMGGQMSQIREEDEAISTSRM